MSIFDVLSKDEVADALNRCDELIRHRVLLAKAFFTDGIEFERMWVRVTGREGRILIGRIDNTPISRNLAYDDEVRFEIEDVLQADTTDSPWETPVANVS